MSGVALREFEVSAQARCRALRDIQSWRASGWNALEAKYEVLCALKTWLNSEDPRLTRFAVQLVSEYRDSASNGVADAPQSRSQPRVTSSVVSWLGFSRILN